MPALALTADVATLTDVASGEGWRDVYAYQLRRLATSADIALAVSSDRECAKVLRGLEAAHELNLLKVALTGGRGGALTASPVVDHAVVGG